LPSETMIWQPEFTDKTLSRKPGAVHHSRMAMNLVAADKHFVIEVVKSLKCSKMQCAIIQ
ncbi:hypothetical protein, partial [Shigella flexneri]|uniref:hypothetical protein n=1 Tax=Shigella flexneri TaxID=623 RepID=UPI003CEDF83B